MKKLLVLLFLLFPSILFAGTIAKQIDFPFAGLTDINGNRLTGGSISFYENNYSTVTRSVWSDANKTLPLSQPIYLNDAGQPYKGIANPVTIYGDGIYRIVVRDSNKTIVYSLSDMNYMLTTGNVTINYQVSVNYTTNNYQVSINYTTNNYPTTNIIGSSVEYVSVNAVLENVYIGDLAGTANTTATSNVYLGSKAGQSTNIGANNVYIGSYTGQSGTSAQENTMVGSHAGYHNIQEGNTFIGNATGYNSLSGIDNTFVGNSAGYNNFDGNSNTFVGNASGYRNTRGGTNTFLGTSSGYSNSLGEGNTFVGNASGLNSSFGNYNAFLGVSSGYSNTFGYDNTFLGNTAGVNNTTGYYNVFIGSNVAASNTRGNSNIVIGANSNTNGVNDTNEIVIGTGVAGGGSNTISLGRINNTQTYMYGNLQMQQGNVLVNNGYFSGNGSNISAINASNISTGTLSNARLDSSVVTSNYNNTVSVNGDIKAVNFIGNGSQLTGISTGGGGITTANADLRYVTPNYNETITANYFAGNGSLLTNLNASNISSGTLSDAYLNSNVVTSNYNATVNINTILSSHLHSQGSVGLHVANHLDQDIAIFGAGGSQSALFYDGTTFQGIMAAATINATYLSGAGTGLTGTAANLTVGTANYASNSGLLEGKTEGTLSVSTANYATNISAVNTVNTANSVTWSGITSKPTTIAGYGITDAIVTSNYNGTINATAYIGNSAYIGTSIVTQNAVLQVIGTGNVTTLPLIRFIGNNTGSSIYNEGYSGSNAPNLQFVGLGARGTLYSPSAIVTADSIVAFSGRGYGTTGFSANSKARMQFFAEETWTDTANGTYIIFITTPTQSVSSVERIRINSAGNVGIGITAPQYKLDVNGTVNATAYIGDASRLTFPTTIVTDNYNSSVSINGNVFIGTSTHNYTLDVNGKVNLGGDNTTSNTKFEATGFMIATNNAMGYEDVIYQNIMSVKSSGAGTLTLTTITGNIQAYAFDVNDYVPITGEFYHKWKIGSKISLHCNIMNKSSDSSDRFVKMQLEYCYADLSGTVSIPLTISNNFTIPANTPINTHFYVELGKETPPLTTVSGHLLGRLTRVLATGTAPSQVPLVLSFGVHGLVDKLGSRSEYAQ